MSRRRGKRIPECSSCHRGICWISSRGNRVPFERLPVDVDELPPDRVAYPVYRGEAWALDDLVVELVATYHWTPGQARTYARERLPWHVPHHCSPTEVSR